MTCTPSATRSPGKRPKTINSAGRVIAVGTTVTRVLESLAGKNQRIAREEDQTGETAIFLHPPYRFKAIDALLTNFHLPQSTLIMLVSALPGAN